MNAVARTRWALPLLTAAAALAVLHALAVGSVELSWADVARAFGGERSATAAVVLDLRLPRALSAFAAGALLALAGAVLQGLLRNPLADPYVLGVSGGASVAALIVLSIVGAATPAWAMQAAAAAGSLVSLLVLFALARRTFFARELALGDDGAVGVLLTGVMLAALCGALVSLLLAVAGDGQLRGMVFWLLGDLAGATDLRWALAACGALLLIAALCRRYAAALDLMLRGDVQAFTQGVDVTRTRRVLVLLAALATAAAVSLAGAVGFVGFVAPHLMRSWLGNDQRVLLLAAPLFGGALVVAADSIARTVIAPAQLPVGVVTALIGAPVFLWFIRHR
jgi:iron complex transport system permease protein